MRMCLEAVALLFVVSCTYDFNDLSCENRVDSSPPPPCPTARPWGPLLARGGGVCSGFGGRPRCLVWRKLNNFKVHLVKRRKTYFNTSFTLSLSLLAGAPPLYVCVRPCERVNVCVILQCISIRRSPKGVLLNERISGIKCIITPEHGEGKQTSGEGVSRNVIVGKCE